MFRGVGLPLGIRAYRFSLTYFSLAGCSVFLQLSRNYIFLHLPIFPKLGSSSFLHRELWIVKHYKPIRYSAKAMQIVPVETTVFGEELGNVVVDSSVLLLNLHPNMKNKPLCVLPFYMTFHNTEYCGVPVAMIHSLGPSSVPYQRILSGK